VQKRATWQNDNERRRRAGSFGGPAEVKKANEWMKRMFKFILIVPFISSNMKRLSLPHPSPFPPAAVVVLLLFSLDRKISYLPWFSTDKNVDDIRLLLLLLLEGINKDVLHSFVCVCVCWFENIFRSQASFGTINFKLKGIFCALSRRELAFRRKNCLRRAE